MAEVESDEVVRPVVPEPAASGYLVQIKDLMDAIPADELVSTLFV